MNRRQWKKKHRNLGLNEEYGFTTETYKERKEMDRNYQEYCNYVRKVNTNKNDDRKLFSMFD